MEWDGWYDTVLIKLFTSRENVMKCDCRCPTNNGISQIKQICQGEFPFVVELYVQACGRATFVNPNIKVYTFMTKEFYKYATQIMHKLFDVILFLFIYQKPFVKYWLSKDIKKFKAHSPKPLRKCGHTM